MRCFALVVGWGALACSGGLNDGGDGSGAGTGGADSGAGTGGISPSSGGALCGGADDEARRLSVDKPEECLLGCGGSVGYSCDTISVNLAMPFDDPDLTLAIATGRDNSIGLVPDVGFPPASCPEKYGSGNESGYGACATEVRENGFLNGFTLQLGGGSASPPPFPTTVTVSLVRRSNDEVLDVEVGTLAYSCEANPHWCWNAAPIVMDLALP